ncbi:chromosome partitioning protein, ParB family [Pseudorhodobacter antarcticus]|uniref:Chromosome partitioning protein, ParB family n=1 Tax=Pseudorhodobacter antarcticus TaxID=1077947 RepID=A0A1H8MY86_9RHOB|nr:chromosome partitioning protein, ParB family [Pseudorhodobacter antarcticus]
MLHDLFQGDDGGWLEDPALLDRFVTERLQIEAETLVPEGWKWIEVSVDLPYGYSHGMRRLVGDPVLMSEDEVATCGSAGRVSRVGRADCWARRSF